MTPAREECWLPLPGYQGWYEVSCHGQVYSMPRAGTRGGILLIQRDSQGTAVVRLSKYGRVRTVTVKSLVRRTFGGSMTQHERDHLTHLANDWDAQAAMLERQPELASYLGRDERKRHILVLRDCAEQLRRKLMLLRPPVFPS